MKLGKKIIALALFGMAASTSAYGIADGAKVESIITYGGNNFASILFDKELSGIASCGSDKANRVMVDISTNKGMSVLSAALTAKTSGATVKVNAYDRCNLVPSIVDINYLWVK